MKATQAQLLNLLDGKKQFTIPIYQRTYSWEIKQCKQLLDDIIRIGKNSYEFQHFIGSIVYFKPKNSPVTSVPELLVIDGQQRLITISLLLIALTNFLKNNNNLKINDESWEEIYDTYIINKHRSDNSKYKLSLTKKDKETYTNLIDNINLPDNQSVKIINNYNFFSNNINIENVQSIYYGIKKLIIVDVILERDKDNPQLIFESLNSTGLDLSQADLIRNFVLMKQNIDVQTYLYEKYWYPMEQSFGEKINNMALFIRDYLTMKTSKIPRFDQVYEFFKLFLNTNNSTISIEQSIEDLYKYSKYYVRITLLKETDIDLRKKFNDIAKLRIDVSFPFLIAVYSDFEAEIINKTEFIQILDIIINYVFRRAICGIPTNSLNKTFATLYKQIKKDNYLESIIAAFLLMDSYKRFPNDSEFIKLIQIKDVYNFRSRNYLLESLENFNKKEIVNVNNYTIEHILPQNENISIQWKNELGDNWKIIKDKYLHTLGNLTLTGYNSELSDRPFIDKKTIPGGFNNSPLFLNEYVRNSNVWNEESINKRSFYLAEKACKIWRSPYLSDECLEKYKQPINKKNNSTYTLDNYEYLNNDMLNLYKELEKKVLNLDPSVRVEFKKLYIAFKSHTNFVDIVPQKKKLHLSLNIKFDKIIDPKDLCRDVTNLGRWGNGNTEVSLNNINDLDYIMELVEQAFDVQEDNL